MAALPVLKGQLGHTGCSKCVWTGCAACDPEQAASKILKKELEWQVLDPVGKLTSLKSSAFGEKDWLVRYYDSLPTLHSGCREEAKVLLQALGLYAHHLPTQSHSALKQDDGSSCGFFCLHWLENEVRKYMGEPDFNCGLVLKDRAAKVQKVKAALQKTA